MTMKGWILVAIGSLFVIFIVQNTQVVGVQFLFWKAEASRILVLMGTFAAGFIAGWLVGRPAKKEELG